jgi:hypothetical protein
MKWFNDPSKHWRLIFLGEVQFSKILNSCPIRLKYINQMSEFLKKIHVWDNQCKIVDVTAVVMATVMRAEYL